MKDDCIAAEEIWTDPRLRVALVTETYPPEINGVAMTLQRMVTGLIERKHRVQLIRPRQGSADVERHTHRFDELLSRGWALPNYQGLRFGLPAKAALLRSWSRQRPDLVHVATEGPLGWSAVSAAIELKVPVTSDFHTNFDHYSRHYGLAWLRQPVTAYLKRFHDRTARTFVPTAEVAALLTGQGYRNLEVVSRGVDTALFSPARRADDLRGSWGLDPDGLAVLYVGRIAPEKNLQLAVRTFAAIRSVRPDARMVFVGDGPMRAGLAREHPEFVFAGMRTGEDLATHYASADLFLFPSLTETFGNVTLEAMASGLAVVAYRYAAAAEVILNGTDGYTAESGHEDAFIDRARVASSDIRRLRVVGGLAREKARTLDWGAVNDRFSCSLLAVWREAAFQTVNRDGATAAKGED